MVDATVAELPAIADVEWLGDRPWLRYVCVLGIYV